MTQQTFRKCTIDLHRISAGDPSCDDVYELTS